MAERLKVEYFVRNHLWMLAGSLVNARTGNTNHLDSDDREQGWQKDEIDGCDDCKWD